MPPGDVHWDEGGAVSRAVQEELADPGNGFETASGSRMPSKDVQAGALASFWLRISGSVVPSIPSNLTFICLDMWSSRKKPPDDGGLLFLTPKTGDSKKSVKESAIDNDQSFCEEQEPMCLGTFAPSRMCPKPGLLKTTSCLVNLCWCLPGKITGSVGSAENTQPPGLNRQLIVRCLHHGEGELLDGTMDFALLPEYFGGSAEKLVVEAFEEANEEDKTRV
ncbi:hypothetical protein THAOC_21409 [Thalassiosira oceanica]|uniref:Uncharacterized protein n=1 Tax=Thalassiosira oceanica TaxID=159749 RepID=K0SIZ0_THAOC|nr:hypothetical protein THAOC_21409 [Thalassiosira oceanica]|eukprot:EJK58462.1 hypothetical protein THAOC_21409 [Thalassiosira oceanica]